MKITLHAYALSRRAQILNRTIGTRRAAGFLRNRAVSLTEALFILTGRVA